MSDWARVTDAAPAELLTEYQRERGINLSEPYFKYSIL